MQEDGSLGLEGLFLAGAPSIRSTPLPGISLKKRIRERKKEREEKKEKHGETKLLR